MTDERTFPELDVRIEDVEVSRLVNNDGQIPDVPANPRTITPEQFEKLKKSLIDDPEMMRLRETVAVDLDGVLVVVMGNMRLKAAKAIGWQTIPCKIIPSSTPAKKIRAYVLKDNDELGEWDEFMLGRDWDLSELKEWGMDFIVDPEEDADPDPSEFEKQFMQYKDENCKYPLVPKFDEKHQLFVILVDSEVDANWLREHLNMQKMKSYKSDRAAKSNVISFKDFKYAFTNRNTEPQESRQGSGEERGE